MNTNKNIASKFRNDAGAAYANPQTEESARNARVERIINRKGSTIHKVAGHTFHHLNFYWPGGQQAFPYKAKHQTVDFYFPFAIGGPLYVDSANEEWQKKICEEKRPVFKKLGLRYLVVEPEMPEHEMHAQLREVDKVK